MLMQPHLYKREQRAEKAVKYLQNYERRKKMAFWVRLVVVSLLIVYGLYRIIFQ